MPLTIYGPRGEVLLTWTAQKPYRRQLVGFVMEQSNVTQPSRPDGTGQPVEDKEAPRGQGQTAEGKEDKP